MIRILATTLLLVFPLGSAILAGQTQPNIVYILADDLGWIELGCQGSKYYETPHIDRMAAQGLRFTSGYACGPNCQPTRACLMSGQYGPRTGVYTVGPTSHSNTESRPLLPVPNVQSLPLEKITVAQALKKAGYATGMFGKWHLGNDPEHHPSQRGFDEAIVSMGKHFDFNTQPNVTVDPKTCLAAEKPEPAKPLHAKLAGWRQSVGAPMPKPRSAKESPEPERRGKRNRRAKAEQ